MGMRSDYIAETRLHFGPGIAITEVSKKKVMRLPSNMKHTVDVKRYCN
jgi:hypothetical protein